MKRTFTIEHADSRRYIAQQVMTAPAGHCVTIAEPTRSLEQNALMWPLLDSIARQVRWDGETMTDEEWKDWFTAALKKQRMVRGMEGGIVFLGGRTSRMSKSDFSELIELIMAFGAQQGVNFNYE